MEGHTVNDKLSYLDGHDVAILDEYNLPDKTEERKNSCNDFFFALLFLGCLGGTVFCSVKYGNSFMNSVKLEEEVLVNGTIGSKSQSGYPLAFNYITYATVASVGISFVWMLLMIVASEAVIYMSLVVMILINIGLGAGGTMYLRDMKTKNYWWPAVTFGLAALLLCIYACCIQKRIKFAAAHLKVAGSAVFSLPVTLIVPFVMLGLQLGWTIGWVSSWTGLLYHGKHIIVPDCFRNAEFDPNECKITVHFGSVLGISFGLMIVFFWGIYVIQNIVQVTVSGAIGGWKLNNGAPFLTMLSWCRALTLSFGSICFGSLVVAILEAIRQVLSSLQGLASIGGNCAVACVLCCISCCVSCVESMVQFFNRFAYSYIGIYGYSFVTASKHVFVLLNSKGWTAIINDDISGNVFVLGNLMVASASCAIGVVLVSSRDGDVFEQVEEPKALVGALSFILGYAVCSVVMSVMSSAVTAVFILWAEDPEGWQVTRPDEYESLHSAWLEEYPEEYNEGQGIGKRIDARV